jgi:hypothetical protein
MKARHAEAIQQLERMHAENHDIQTDRNTQNRTLEINSEDMHQRTQKTREVVQAKDLEIAHKEAALQRLKQKTKEFVDKSNSDAAVKEKILATRNAEHARAIEDLEASHASALASAAAAQGEGASAALACAVAARDAEHARAIEDLEASHASALESAAAAHGEGASAALACAVAARDANLQEVADKEAALERLKERTREVVQAKDQEVADKEAALERLKEKAKEFVVKAKSDAAVHASVVAARDAEHKEALASQAQSHATGLSEALEVAEEKHLETIRRIREQRTIGAVDTLLALQQVRLCTLGCLSKIASSKFANHCSFYFEKLFISGT